MSESLRPAAPRLTLCDVAALAVVDASVVLLREALDATLEPGDLRGLPPFEHLLTAESYLGEVDTAIDGACGSSTRHVRGEHRDDA